MPRASNSAKRQQAAGNHRDTRHENGLVNPARRVVKQKSQTQLDGSARPAVDNATVPPVPAVSLPNANGSAKHHDDMAPDRKTADGPRSHSLGAHADSSTDSLPAPVGQHTPEERHRQINVNDAKNTNVHRDPGPLDFAVTVLRSCPLHDTIAILIILMQVSPVALATIYMLFTLLTFVPPVTTSSGISITEIFDGIQGTPSLWTLVGMDVVMLLIWLFLFAPAQKFILDLAQVVIALTLGGGASSRTGATNNIFICITIVGLSQWTRSSKWTSLSRLTTLFGPNGPSRFFSPDPDDPLESTVRAFEKRGTYGWVRSILAIHILTQGLVRWIREWYLRREKKDWLSQAQQDPEAGKSASFPADPSVDGAAAAGNPDPSSSHGSSAVSTKKRRKQSAQVRIRQPLWAALASTKIVMVKEYELSHAASESAGSNATDIHNLGNAPFNTQPEQIWICYIGCDEVCFNTSHFPEDDSEPHEGTPAGIDASKPFYVRVNNAMWQPTRITPIEDGDEDGRRGTCWTGDIYGLTPLSTYDCEFVSTRTGEVIFATSVRTIQAKTNDLDAPSRATNAQRARSRHDSPASTLRASIAAAELKLGDEKARLKAARRDHKTRVNAAKKEIDKLTSAVQSAGGNDEKLRQKVAQNSIQQKQAEQSIHEVEAELKDLETVPEELLEQYRAKQTKWTSEKAQFDGARASFKSFKTSVDRELKALEEESVSLQAKRSKIASRIVKVDNEHARITDANARGLDEAERRRQGRAALEADAARSEQQLADRINTLRAMNASKHAQIHDMAGYLSAYLSSFQEEDAVEQPSPQNQYNTWAASPAQFNPQPLWPPTSMPAPGAALGPAISPFMNPLQPAIGTPPQQKTRGRSSSMLSDVSGFTQSTDDDDRTHHAGVIAPPGLGPGQSSLQGTPNSTFHAASGFSFMHARDRGDVGSGSGSGSGTGSGSPIGSGRSSVRSGSGSGGSVRDPTSPV